MTIPGHVITNVARPSLRHRNPILFWVIIAPIAAISLGLSAAIVTGTVKAVAGSHSVNQIVIEKTGSMYQDCTAFANARGFAVDVCEALNPSSTIARTNCAEEIRNHEAQVDCPATLKP